MNYKPMIAEISQVTGIGRRTIIYTISKYKQRGNVTFSNKKRKRTTFFNTIDDIDRNKIRTKIHSLWLRREVPNIDKILTTVREDTSLPNFKRTTLFKIIKKLGFISLKNKSCSVLTEKPDLICWRRRYFYDILRFRNEGHTVYYLDEMSLNARLYVNNICMDTTIKSNCDTFNKGVTTGPKNPISKAKRLIVLHIGSNNGFLPGGLLCYDGINGASFREWFKSIIPLLEPNSIIVLDNAPYHSIKAKNIPTSKSKRAEILKLISKFINPKMSMKKNEFLNKSSEIQRKYSSCIIDNIAKAAGHIVLRVPPDHYNLNPCELTWAMVKKYMKEINTTYKTDNVYQLLNMAVERVTKENWQNFIRDVIKEEEKIMEIDDIMDDIFSELDPYVTTITKYTNM